MIRNCYLIVFLQPPCYKSLLFNRNVLTLVIGVNKYFLNLQRLQVFIEWF